MFEIYRKKQYSPTQIFELAKLFHFIPHPEQGTGLVVCTIPLNIPDIDLQDESVTCDDCGFKLWSIYERDYMDSSSKEIRTTCEECYIESKNLYLYDSI